MIKLPTRSKTSGVKAKMKLPAAPRIKLKLNLKFAFIIAIAAILGMLLAAVNYSMFKTNDTTITYRFLDDVRVARDYFFGELNKTGEQLTAQLDVLRFDVNVQLALRNRDRARLNERTVPVFTELQKNYDVTHLFLNDEKRVNVFRAHQPSAYGDTIDRVPVLLAEKTGKTAIGLEMSPSGAVTMRSVQLIYDKVGMAGYFEIGQNIDKLFRSIKDVTSLEAIFVLDKKNLSRPDWEAGMKKLGYDPKWEMLPNVVVSRETANFPANALMQVLNMSGATPYAVVKVGAKTYYGDVFDIKDVAGRRIGSILLLRDLAHYTSDTTVAAVYLSMGYVLAGVMIIAMMFLLTKQGEKRLEEAQRTITDTEEKLVASEREFESMHQQHISELEGERDKLQQAMQVLQKNEQDLNLAAVVFENSTEGILITDPQTNILRVNQSFTEITGYVEEEVLGKKAKLLRSSRHDATFFQNMWAHLLEYGNWQGEIWNCRKNGETYPEWLSISAIQDDKRETMYYLGFFSDLTEKKISDARNHHLSNYDPLTELPNRHMLEDRLKQALSDAHHHRTVLALLHINLDRFKPVVDSLGHPFGDKLLRAVAERLTGYIRDTDTFARFSGDEFAVILTEVGSQANAGMVAQKVLNAFGKSFEIEDQEIYLSASVGIAVYPSNAMNKDDLIQSANIAARHAREEGGNCYHFYASEMTEAASHRLTLENSLRRALENEEFVLYYQPQINLKTGKIIGMEALIRWHHPARGLIYPDEYIPVLEETGLIVPVGDWVLHTACHQAAEWQRAGYPKLRVGVNLSARQFRQNDLVSAIEYVLEDTGLTMDQLELEITESVLLQDVPAAITILNRMHELGIHIAIDDFGTGYSSLSYLKQLPLSKIKIDRSFIKDIGTPHDDGSIANAVISLGHSLKMSVIAEGVETEEQLHYLTANGCDEMQGYYFSRPVPADEFVVLLERGINLDTPRRAYHPVDDMEPERQRSVDAGDLEFS